VSKLFKVIIAGGRDFDNYDSLEKICMRILQNKDNVEVVSGTAKGADSLGEDFAINNNLGLKSFPAPWDDIDRKPDNQIGERADGKKYWKKAGHYRNKQMAEYADAAIIFHDGKSRGTANMITQMEKLKKPFKVIKYGKVSN
jgi:hypothetical protein